LTEHEIPIAGEIPRAACLTSIRLDRSCCGPGGVVAAAPGLRRCVGWILTALPSIAKTLFSRGRASERQLEGWG
jgi:hypothetical protein